MADIFVAYAKKDTRRARLLATALRDRGWTVWFDRKITTSHASQSLNRQQIEEAKVVLTLWSRHSVDDPDVGRFTKYGMEINSLVTVRLDGARVPEPYTRVRPFNLKGWKGQSKHSGFDQMINSIEFYLQAEPEREGVRLAPPKRAPARRTRETSAWTEQALVLRLALAGLFALYALMPESPLFRSVFDLLADTDLAFLSPDATKGLLEYPTWAYHGLIILMVLSAALLLLGFVTRLAAIVMLSIAVGLFIAASIVVQDYISLLPTFGPIIGALVLLLLFGAGRTSLDAVALR